MILNGAQNGRGEGGSRGRRKRLNTGGVKSGNHERKRKWEGIGDQSSEAERRTGLTEAEKIESIGESGIVCWTRPGEKSIKELQRGNAFGRSSSQPAATAEHSNPFSTAFILSLTQTAITPF